MLTSVLIKDASARFMSIYVNFPHLFSCVIVYVYCTHVVWGGGTSSHLFHFFLPSSFEAGSLIECGARLSASKPCEPCLGYPQCWGYRPCLAFCVGARDLS